MWLDLTKKAGANGSEVSPHDKLMDIGSKTESPYKLDFVKGLVKKNPSFLIY